VLGYVCAPPRLFEERAFLETGSDR
jgi:hypothetical protein